MALTHEQLSSTAAVDFHFQRPYYDLSAPPQQAQERERPAMEFQNPLLPSGQDPFVTLHNGEFTYIHAGASLGWTPVYASVADSLTGLRTAERIPVWIPPKTGEASTDIWAPEIHFLDDQWWMYVAAWSGVKGDPHRMYVLEGGQDPREGFSMKAEISSPQTVWGIDGTVFQAEDRTYYVWSGKEELTIDESMPTGISYTSPDTQHLFISEMKSPWELTGSPVKISSPTFDWEFSLPQPVNEGPQVLQSPIRPQGRLMTFSAGHTMGPDYKNGMLVNDSGAFLDADAWFKIGQPVFAKTDEVFGPGHPSYVIMPDGQNWVFYHSAKTEYSGLDRQVNAQPFTWSSDGLPLFGRPVSPRERLIDTTKRIEVIQSEPLHLYQPSTNAAD